MVFQKGQQQNSQPRQKPKKDDCIIDVKKTKSGKRIKISGSCNREQIKMASGDDNLVD